MVPARLDDAARGWRVSVGICGTLHSFPVPEDISSYSFYLPDTFAAEPTAYPPDCWISSDST